MADTLGADSLRYLPVESIARAVGFDAINFARPASPANIRRRSGRSSIRSHSRKPAVPPAAGRTKRSRRTNGFGARGSRLLSLLLGYILAQIGQHNFELQQGHRYDPSDVR